MSIISIADLKRAIRALYNNKGYEVFDQWIGLDCAKDKSAAKYGPMTSDISSYLGRDVSSVRRALNRYFKSGEIFKSSTSGGSCRWSYEGLLEDLSS